jgi:MazG family protein
MVISPRLALLNQIKLPQRLPKGGQFWLAYVRSIAKASPARIRLAEAIVNENSAGEKFQKLLEVMAQLRSEEGCPWDKAQTHASLKACLLEETYELLEALDAPNDGEGEHLREELGDVLLQVVFHSQIASEQNRFTAADVITKLTDKLIRRHPYVFAGAPLPKDTASVLKQRLQIKADEKREGNAKSALGTVPKTMPALARAQSITSRAAHLGFDWPDIDPVWGKIEEEIRELKYAAACGDKQRTEEELGDLLFSVVNLARFLKIEAEHALAETINRFTRRFRYIEDHIRGKNKEFDQVSLEEMDALWEQAKKIEAQVKSPK